MAADGSSSARRRRPDESDLAAWARRNAHNLEREYCRRRFVYFVRQSWSVLEPATHFAYEYYVDAICEHLEAVFRGETRALVINIPPRLAKSLLVAVFWPAWVWTMAPHLRFLYASYAEFLSRRDSRKTRTLIRSQWYQRLWGHVFNLVEDQNQVLRFDNDAHGYRIATSVGGIGTGEGGDVVCVDDPISIMQAFSPTKLDDVMRWWDEQMSTRLNNPKTGARVIVMQRSHLNDLSGHVLEQGGYTHLMLPMEYEPDRCCYTEVRPRYRQPFAGEDEQGWYRWDLREEEGEPLSPQRFGPDEIAEVKMRLVSPHAVASQLQQRPSQRGGGLIKLDWFNRYRTPPDKAECDMIVHSWDTANKGGQENAYSVGGVWYVKGNRYYLINVYRGRLNIPRLERTVINMANSDAPNAVLIEDAASGTGVIQHIQNETTLPVIPVRPDKDKATRMDIETPAIEAGRVWLPEYAPWLPDFEGEVEAFPNGPYLDQADMMSQFLKWMRERPMMSEDDWMLY